MEYNASFCDVCDGFMTMMRWIVFLNDENISNDENVSFNDGPKP